MWGFPVKWRTEQSMTVSIEWFCSMMCSKHPAFLPSPLRDKFHLDSIFSSMAGHSVSSIRPRFHNGIDEFYPRKHRRRGLPGPPWRPSRGVVSTATSCPVLALLAVFWNQTGNPRQSFNYPFFDLFVRPISPFHFAVWHFPKLETGMNPAHKQAGWNVQRTLLVLKRTQLVLGRTLHILELPVFQSCLQKQLKAILFLNYAKPPG